jgi:hypothetical protein
LTFDALERPVPFLVTTEGGVEDLVELDGKGPQLLVPHAVGDHWRPPRYFVTTLYEKRGVYWYRADGLHGEHVFPASELPPKGLIEKPAGDAGPADLTNDPARGRRAGRETRFAVVVRDSTGGRDITFPMYVPMVPEPRGVRAGDVLWSLQNRKN